MFPREKSRGLIEAMCESAIISPACRFRGRNPAASLKPFGHVMLSPVITEFPREKSRGLIEARSCATTTNLTKTRFRGRNPAASLKHDHLVYANTH